MIRRASGWIGLAALAAVLAYAGYWLLFTIFMGYDDEGYVLISLRNYAEHGGLYDRVFSQYGPFFFAAFDAVHRALGFAWTNTNGRVLTLAVWAATAILSAAITWRRTRSEGATALTLAGVFVYLWVMVHEPTHPGGLVGLLVALAALIGVVSDPGRSLPAVAALGAIAAALALTKINVGVFLFTAAGAWLAAHACAPRVRKAAGWVMTAWLVLLPWILMRPMIDQAWVIEFAAVSSLASLGAFAVVRAEGVPTCGWREVAAFTGGAALVTIATVGVILSRGTSLHGLLAGVVLDPLNQPSVYHFAFSWRPGTMSVAVASLALTLAALRWPESSIVKWSLVAMRLLVFAAFVLSAVGLVPTSFPALGTSFGVALAGLCALPLCRNSEGLEDARVRQWLAIILVLQFLHAYPVAGSQLNWATFLWIPLLILAVRDVWRSLPPVPRLQFLPTAAALVAFGLAGFMSWKLWDITQINRRQGEPLGLPGAEKIIVPDDTVFAMRVMAENARAHADMLFSVSGLYSFNLWTGLPTPTLANATQWFESLSHARQQAIIDSLEAHPDAALIIQTELVGYLVRNGFRIHGPLADYLAREFQAAFRVDDYAFWVRRGRRVAPLSTGAIAPAGERTGHRQLELVLSPLTRPIARVELWKLDGDSRRHLLSFSAANAVLAVTPLDSKGLPKGLALEKAWSVPLPPGIIKAVIALHDLTEIPQKTVAFVFDSDGHRMAVARVLP